eukprot:3645165-Amphidinium_carterae.2
MFSNTKLTTRFPDHVVAAVCLSTETCHGCALLSTRSTTMGSSPNFEGRTKQQLNLLCGRNLGNALASPPQQSVLP